MINDHVWQEISKKYLNSKPFEHVVIDNFLNEEIASEVSSEFPSWESPDWTYTYKNPVEDKKLCSHWDKFKTTTYKLLWYFNSDSFVIPLQVLTKNPNIQLDIGMHGGGYHGHNNGGILSKHLDYDIHPKLGMQRKLNMIIYLTKNWEDSWGGGLGLWSGDDKTASKLEKNVAVKFNRAIIFDTTQNSWHGLVEPVTCPSNVIRKSLAVYYVHPAPKNSSDRKRARFLPTDDQKDNNDVIKFCRDREIYYGY